MNKFYVIMFILLFGIFVGIFGVTQKDSIINGSFMQAASPILPSEAVKLEFNLLTPRPQQNGAQGAQTAQTQQNAQQQAQNGQSGAAPTYGVEEGVKASYSATLSTSKGDIKLTLFGQDAPRTVKNFVDKAKSGFYKNLAFHRVEDWVVQGGDPQGDGSGGGMMQTEINSHHFIVGSLGIARGNDIKISNASQFFITKTEASWLDSQYTNFGQVTDGLDVVNKMGVGDKILGITIE